MAKNNFAEKNTNEINHPNTRNASEHLDNGVTLDNSKRSSNKNDQTIRVGEGFQAKVPSWDPKEARNNEQRKTPEEEQKIKIKDEFGTLCFWSPPNEKLALNEKEILDFVTRSRENGYQEEQALGILLYHNYNIPDAERDIKDYRPAETGIDSWDADDRTIFETAYRLHAKSFLKIRETLPNKKISDLVHYYYRWKKTSSGIDKKNLQDKNTRKTGNGTSNSAKNGQAAKDADERRPTHFGRGIESERPLFEPQIIAQTIEQFHNKSCAELKQKIQEFERTTELQKAMVQSSKQKRDMVNKKNVNSIEEEVTRVVNEHEEALDIRFQASDIIAIKFFLQENGENYELMSRLMLTKTPEQLEIFIKKDREERKYDFASDLKKWNEQGRVPKIKLYNPSS